MFTKSLRERTKMERKGLWHCDRDEQTSVKAQRESACERRSSGSGRSNTYARACTFTHMRAHTLAHTGTHMHTDLNTQADTNTNIYTQYKERSSPCCMSSK